MKKTSKIFLLIGALSFATLSISTPLLHNHKIDFNDHYDCPAFILNLTLIATVFIFLTKLITNFPKPKYQIAPGKLVIPSNKKYRSSSSRAPPF